MPYPSYSYDGPASGPKDEVRFLVGDVGPDFLLADEDLEYLLGEYPQPLLSASHAARSLAARFASKIDRSVGELSVQYSQLMAHYTDLADRLQRQARQRPSKVFAWGYRQTQHEIDAGDADRDGVRRGVQIGMQSNRRAVQPPTASPSDLKGM